jgi:hypothetical protein
VSKVSWAHPEFGSIIASSSFDRTVKIWEQMSLVRLAETQQIGVNGSSGSAQASPSNSRWVERAVLTDARGTIRSVEFAPHHFGLKLVSLLSPKKMCSTPKVNFACTRQLRQRYPLTIIFGSTNALNNPPSRLGNSQKSSKSPLSPLPSLLPSSPAHTLSPLLPPPRVTPPSTPHQLHSSHKPSSSQLVRSPRRPPPHRSPGVPGWGTVRPTEDGASHGARTGIGANSSLLAVEFPGPSKYVPLIFFRFGNLLLY